MKRPNIVRPSRIPPNNDFNEDLAMDVFCLRDVDSRPYYALNILELNTTYQVSVLLEDLRPSTVCRAFGLSWGN